MNNKITNVIICGLGGVGSVYASKIVKYKQFCLKVLVDNDRKQKYSKIPTIINGEEFNFKYITPDENFNPDLIIVAAKYTQIDEVVKEIKPFVKTSPIVLSLMNGVSSEDVISSAIGKNPLKSYLICNSIMRERRNVFHDDINKIVIERNNNLEEFFKTANINYDVSDDIKTDMWQKYMLNVTANQLSAVTRRTFGDMNNIKNIDEILRHILNEVVEIAKCEGVNNPEQLAQKTIQKFKHMAPYGKTSMLQDVENNRETEVEAFSGTLIKLGKKYNIKTPYNDLFYYLLAS